MAEAVDFYREALGARHRAARGQLHRRPGVRRPADAAERPRQRQRADAALAAFRSDPGLGGVGGPFRAAGRQALPARATDDLLRRRADRAGQDDDRRSERQSDRDQGLSPTEARSSARWPTARDSKSFSHRIAIIGNSGAGKSTLARAVSARLAHSPCRTGCAELAPRMDRAAPERSGAVVAHGSRGVSSGEAWITDGNYSKGAQPHILPRATDVVWLDYPRRILLPRVDPTLVRSGRSRKRGTLAGHRQSGRVQSLAEPGASDPLDVGHLRQRHGASRQALFASDTLAHARRHRFRHPSEADAWLRTLADRGDQDR